MSRPERRGSDARFKAAHRTAAFLGLLLCACFCLTQLAEVDLYWHLLAGRLILDEGHVPRVDTFTYTSSGRPWIDLHWLFQVGVESARRLGGWGALDALKVGLIVAGFGAALAAAFRRRFGAVPPFLLVLGIVAAQERFTLRPEAASFLLLGILLYLITLRHERPRVLWLAPPLIALWANVHALFAIGVGVLALVSCGDAFDDWRDRRRSGEPIRLRTATLSLLAVLACSIPATLVTPYGLSGWSLPRTLLLERIATGNVFGRNIAEFQAPFSGFGTTTAVLAFGLLAAILVLAALYTWKGAKAADLLLVAAFLGLALLARRNIPLLALVALPAGTPIVAQAWERLSIRLQDKLHPPRRIRLDIAALCSLMMACVTLVLMGDVLSNRFFARDGTQRYLGFGVAPGYYPEGAARFVEERSLPGQVFNDLPMGGFLAWRFHPRRQVYIDGRLEVPDPELFATYLRLQSDPDRFEQEVGRYGIRTVIWAHRDAIDAAPLLHHLAHDARWRLAYADIAAAVFVRMEGERGRDAPAGVGGDSKAMGLRILDEAEAAARQRRLDDPLPSWARRWLPRRDVPAEEVGAALFFALIEQPDIALPLFRDAVRRAPWSAPLHYDLGLVLAESGLDLEAQNAFDDAERLDPGMVEAVAAGALVRLRGGDEAGARASLLRAAALGRLPAPALRARGMIAASDGRAEEAIADYRAAVIAEPGQSAWRSELAMLLAERGLMAQAQAEIEQVLRLNPSGCVPRVAAARLKELQNDPLAAEAMLREAVRDAAPCPEGAVALARLLVAAGRPGEAGALLEEAIRSGASRGALAGDPVFRGLVPNP